MTSLTERQDFRCKMCQMKHAFHCEHDTPYRDQYLGMFDPNLPRERLVNVQHSRNEKSSTNTNGSGQHVNSKSNSDRNKKTTGKTTTTTANSADKDKQSKTKSCTIL